MWKHGSSLQGANDETFPFLHICLEYSNLVPSPLSQTCNFQSKNFPSLLRIVNLWTCLFIFGHYSAGSTEKEHSSLGSQLNSTLIIGRRKPKWRHQEAVKSNILQYTHAHAHAHAHTHTHAHTYIHITHLLDKTIGQKNTISSDLHFKIKIQIIFEITEHLNGRDPKPPHIYVTTAVTIDVFENLFGFLYFGEKSAQIKIFRGFVCTSVEFPF